MKKFGEKVRVFIDDGFQGIVVGIWNPKLALRPEGIYDGEFCNSALYGGKGYIVKCIDGTYPNEEYPYDTFLVFECIMESSEIYEKRDRIIFEFNDQITPELCKEAGNHFVSDKLPTPGKSWTQKNIDMLVEDDLNTDYPKEEVIPK